MRTSIFKNSIILGLIGLTALLGFQNCSNDGVDLVSEFDQQLPQELKNEGSHADPSSQAALGSQSAPVVRATPRPGEAPVAQATPRPQATPQPQATPRPQPTPTGQAVCIGDLYYAANPYRDRENYPTYGASFPFKFSLRTGETLKDNRCLAVKCNDIGNFGTSCMFSGSTVRVMSFDCKSAQFKGEKGYKLVVKCGPKPQGTGLFGDGSGGTPFEIRYNFTQGQYSIEAERCDCGV